MAHHLSNIADLTGEMDAQDEAFKTIDEAIEVFTEVREKGLSNSLKTTVARIWQLQERAVQFCALVHCKSS